MYTNYFGPHCCHTIFNGLNELRSGLSQTQAHSSFESYSSPTARLVSTFIPKKTNEVDWTAACWGVDLDGPLPSLLCPAVRSTTTSTPGQTENRHHKHSSFLDPRNNRSWQESTCTKSVAGQEFGSIFCIYPQILCCLGVTSSVSLSFSPWIWLCFSFHLGLEGGDRTLWAAFFFF